ncbi:hypothetical protein ACWGB8_38205, partial [Kitasatospora sp. NPDC054939]
APAVPVAVAAAVLPAAVAVRALPGPRPGTPGAGPAAAAYGTGLAGLLLVPLVAGGGDAAATAALVVAAALSAGSAQWAARWFRRVGSGHLGAASTLAEFRSRMRPVLPVAVALHLTVLAVLTFAALAVLTALAPRPGPDRGGGLLHTAAERADAVQWAGQGALGLLLVLAVLLAHGGRTTAGALAALAGPVALAAPAAWAGAGRAAGPLGCGALALAVLGYAWAVLGRVGAHR